MSVSQLGAILDQLATVVASAPGIKRVYPNLSVFVNAADAPLVLVSVQGGVGGVTAIGVPNQLHHQVRLILLVAPLAADTDVLPLMRQAADLLAAVLSTLFPLRTLLIGPSQVMLAFDQLHYDGPKQLEFGSGAWIAVELTVPVIEFLTM